MAPINQEYGSKRKSNQTKLLAGQFRSADQRPRSPACQPVTYRRRRDLSPVEVVEPFTAPAEACQVEPTLPSKEAYSPVQERFRAYMNRVVALTDEEFAFVLAHLQVKPYKKHQFLIQAGQCVEYCYFVASGLLKLFYTQQSGKQHIVSFAMEDGWESDFRAYFTRTRATLSLECLEDTTVFCLSLVQRVPKALLASYLGVTRETLSRLTP